MLSSNGHGMPVQTALGAAMLSPSKASTTSFADAPMEGDETAKPIRQLDTEFTFSGMAAAKTKKSSSSSHASAAVLDDDDEDEEDDESFDGHESEDDDVHSDDDDDSDMEEEVVATGHRDRLKKPTKRGSSSKRAALEYLAKKKRQFEEASRRLGVPVDPSDDSDADEEIDLSDTDGECTDDDGDDGDEDSYDMTERPEDREGIVRSNVDRLRDALGQKRLTTSSSLSASARLQDAMSKKNYDHLATDDERARARRRDLAIESERTLMETLAEAGLAVNSRDPMEEGGGSGASDDDADEDESPACALVPALLSQVAADEPTLAESLGEMSRMIMGGVLVGYTKGAPMSTDIGAELQKVWGDSSTACRFYLTWRQTLLHLVERTKLRQCGALFAAYLAATKSQHAYEMELVDYSINPALLTDESPAFHCAQCACVVAPRPKPDSMVQTLPVTRFVFHRTNSVAGKTVRVLSAGVSPPPLGGALAKVFVTCDRCAPLLKPLNMMLLAPFLVASLAQAFLMERPEEDGRVVLDAFTAWEPRTKLCTAIAASYKLLHAVALD